MNRPAVETESTKRNVLLSVLASLLIFAGVVALFASELVDSLLPPEIAKPLVENALLVLLIGIGIEGYQIFQLVKTSMARAKRAGLLSSAATLTIAPVPGYIPDDPVAQRTEWTPASRGGANFRTKHLVARGPGRFEVRATWQMSLFCWLFILIGVAVSVGFAFAGRADSLKAIAPVLFGVLFSAIGIAMLYVATRPVVFDRQSGWYWKGSPALRSPSAIRKLKQATELSSIHALQLIVEQVRGKNSSYSSYELNLVLKDGRRINIMDHGDRKTLIADAEALASFLGVPVWNKGEDTAPSKMASV